MLPESSVVSCRVGWSVGCFACDHVNQCQQFEAKEFETLLLKLCSKDRFCEVFCCCAGARGFVIGPGSGGF